jgi:hypothetical protein
MFSSMDMGRLLTLIMLHVCHVCCLQVVLAAAATDV